ncbi:hypothetical protein KIN20_003012 [Parelaphostrongylus tenuis]|uniref:Uncharacterized protein n=1 Tax=Parelaphostrongylus tenuis TaxID=148309 RepID=A0AAD5QI84_PARTN|nr:hypothetical protein KIN20_003012 [Parelaphostrongylus tenuis]
MYASGPVDRTNLKIFMECMTDVMKSITQEMQASKQYPPFIISVSHLAKMGCDRDDITSSNLLMAALLRPSGSL